MAENENQNNGKQDSQSNDTPVNPMKAVNTTPLPVKHEFSSDQGHKNSEKRNNED